MIRSKAAVLFVLVACGLTSTKALAQTQSFCFLTYTQFKDNGTGDGNEAMATDGYMQLNGATVLMERRATSSCSSAVVQNYTLSLNEQGCASFSGPLNVCYVIGVSATGVPQGATNNNTLSIRNNSDNAIPMVVGSAVPTATTTVLYPGPTDALRVYATLAFSMRYFNAGIANRTLNAYLTTTSVRCPCAGTGPNYVGPGFACGGVSANTDHICLNGDGPQRKFAISHEYGHTVANGTNDCSYDNPEGHSIDEIEYTSCGFQEGWAHFVAVDIWTNHPSSDNNPTGRLGYWDSIAAPRICNGAAIASGAVVIDAESSTGGSAANACPIAYYESVTPLTCLLNPPCPPDPYAGFANELDWLRTFWDFHTNAFSGTLGSRPSHADLRNMFSNSVPWGDRSNSYDRFRIGAASLGCGQYERLVDHADANGTNHCRLNNDCVNVSACTPNVD